MCHEPVNLVTPAQTTLRQLGYGRIDEHELIWQYIRQADLDKPLPVTEISPQELADLGAEDHTLLASFKHATKEQRQIVANYMRRLKSGDMSPSELTIVMHVDLLLDGHHRGVAAIKANIPLLCVDVSELPD